MTLFALVGFTFAASSMNPVSLVSVPYERTTFNPLEKVPVLFDNRDAGITANMTMKTKVPTINLVNFPQIKRISCSGPEVSIVFQDATTSRNAFTEWTKNNVVMIAAAKYNCDGPRFSFLSSAGMTLNQATLTVPKQLVPVENVILEFSLDLDDDGPSTALTKRQSKPNVIPLNLNHDGNKVQKSSLLLWSKGANKAECVNCYMKGASKIRATIAGSLDKFHTFKLDLNGEFTANLGLKLNIQKSASKELFSKPILSRALNPIQVNGLFELGPEISLNVGASDFSIGKSVQLEFGTLLRFPHQFSVSAPKGLPGIPEFKFVGSPKHTPLPFRLNIGAVTLKAHLTPKISVGFKIANQGIQTALKFDNILGVEAKVTPSCAQAPVQVKLFNEHKVGFKSEVWKETLSFDVWTSGKNPLICPFCNKCPKSK
jgi:hypothetical protein